MKKVVLITGAGKNLGSHFAIQFAALGYSVVIHYNTSKESAERLCDSITQSGGDAITCQADLSEPSSAKNVFDVALDKFGSVDVLINNAGVFPKEMLIGDVSSVIWNNVMQINLSAGFEMSREFSKQTHFSDTHIGKIINISSVGAKKIFKHKIPYNISKSAVINMTRVLARELSPYITVNCVSPGIIQYKDSISYPIKKENIPLRCYGKAEDITGIVTFLCSDYGNYITGQNICVDGGMELI